MKYLYYIFVFFTIIIRHTIGLVMIWFAIPFRKYGRSVVYNYHLQNGIFLKRLFERKPRRTPSGWTLNGGEHSSTIGFVKYRDVNKIQYYLVLWFIWLWLDDDSNEDTYSAGFNMTIVNGERKTWMPEFIKRRLHKAATTTNVTAIRGNSFDLGDVRGEYPLFEFWSVLLWTLRNSAYNFNYKFNEIKDTSMLFRIVIFGRLFGWDKYRWDNYSYHWEFGKKVK